MENENREKQIRAIEQKIVRHPGAGNVYVSHLTGKKPNLKLPIHPVHKGENKADMFGDGKGDY